MDGQRKSLPMSSVHWSCLTTHFLLLRLREQDELKRSRPVGGEDLYKRKGTKSTTSKEVKKEGWRGPDEEVPQITSGEEERERNGKITKNHKSRDGGSVNETQT